MLLDVKRCNPVPSVINRTTLKVPPKCTADMAGELPTAISGVSTTHVTFHEVGWHEVNGMTENTLVGSDSIPAL